jgi:hypothetical protein
VTSSKWESTSVDLDYYETTLTEEGALSSPNLFSYTLPGTMHGECAVHFRLTGPTICVGEDGGCGHAALAAALRFMAAGAAPVMIAGWLDDLPSRPELIDDSSKIMSGAVFVILEKAARLSPEPVCRLRYSGGTVYTDAGTPVESVLDLFGREPSGGVCA